MKINFNDLEIKIRRLKYRFKSNFLTLNNIIAAALLFVVISWVWGNISSMERNYVILRKLELKQREALVAEINYKTLQYEQKYLQSSEYQEIAARSKLGLASDGEKVLILSKYPEEGNSSLNKQPEKSNFTKWMNFLFGGNAQKTSKDKK